MLSPFFAWDIFDEPPEKRPQWSMLSNFSPLVDIKETGEAIVLRCEMPGIPPDRINVDFNDGCIIISGTKPSVQECGEQICFGQDQGKVRASTESGTTGASGTGAWEGSGSQQERELRSVSQQQGQGLQGQQQQGMQGYQQRGLQGQQSQQPQQGQQGQQYQQEKQYQQPYQQGLATQGQTQRHGKQSEKVQWHRIESASGEFRRSFRLPRGVNAKHIKATSKYGVLEIVVSKPSELQKESGERININSASA